MGGDLKKGETSRRLAGQIHHIKDQGGREGAGPTKGNS